MEAAGETAFGAGWADPARTAAVLRAKAAAAGIDVQPVAKVSLTDLAGAVVAAHAWAAVLDAPSLTHAYRFGDDERRTAARILARASGALPACDPLPQVTARWVETDTVEVPHQVLARTGQVLRWLPRVLSPADQVGALVSAADDLLTAGTPRLRAVGLLLLAEAEHAS